MANSADPDEMGSILFPNTIVLVCRTESVDHLCQVNSSTLTPQTSPFSTARYPVSFLLLCYVEIPVINVDSVDPDQTLPSAASDLDLHSLPMFFLWDAKHK